MTGEPNLISSQMYTLAQQAVQAGHANVQMAVENERLRHRLNQRQATEDAYSQVQPHQGTTLVLDRTGRWVELLNREVEWAGYYVPQPPSEQRPFYAIQLKEIDRVLCLSEQEFMNDKVLIQRIQELPGVEVKLRQSQRTTAFLLRKAFKPLPYNLPFYGGWLLSQGEDFDFQVFPTLSTHRAGDEFCDVVPLPALELPIHAVREWKRMGAIVADANVRWLLQLWFHGAVLTTLLEHMGYPIPLALCLCTTGNAWPSWLRGFFQWFGDPALAEQRTIWKVHWTQTAPGPLASSWHWMTIFTILLFLLGQAERRLKKTEKSGGFGGCWNRQHGKRAIAMDLRTDSCPLHGHI